MQNSPLDVRLVDGRLVISIGIECLANALKFAPQLARFNELKGDYVEPKVTDVVRFAEEMANELRSESDDGTTCVHRMLDAAAERCIENGAVGIWVPGVDDV